MPITEHSLLRSGRAATPRPAPTSGVDTQAHRKTRMTDARDSTLPIQSAHGENVDRQFKCDCGSYFFSRRRLMGAG